MRMADTPTTTTTAAPFLPPLSSESSPPKFPPANPPATKTITRLTGTSFYASLVSLFFILVTTIIVIIAPVSSWYFGQRRGGLAIFLVFAALLSLFNRAALNFGPPPHTTPLLLNLVLDAVLAFGVLIPALSMAVDLGQQDLYRTCRYDNYYPPYRVPPRKCITWLSVICVLVGICCVGGLIVGVSHLTLFILRGINTWRSHFWSRPFPWLAPTGGQVAVEFNLRIVRPEDAAAGHVEGQRFRRVIEERGDEEDAGEVERLVDV